MKTTNVIKRLNLELKRRTNKIYVFLSYITIMRLAVAILIDTNEE
ncbi:MAG: transposase [Thermoplasmataceae archaeon]